MAVRIRPADEGEAEPTVPPSVFLHFDPVSKNVLAKSECSCNMLSVESSPALLLVIDALRIKEVKMKRFELLV